MKTGQTRPRTARIWIATVIAILLIFYVVHLMTRGSLPIRAAQATVGSMTNTVSTNGKVEPQPQNNYEAHAPFAGIIQSIDVHEGDKVHAGQLLLSMDDTEAKARVATAEAALKGAQASYQAAKNGGTQEERIGLKGDIEKAQIDRSVAQKNLEALQKLQSSGAASPSEVSAAQTRLAADSSTLRVLQQRLTGRYGSEDIAHAEATLADAQAAWQAAQDALHQAIVHAPFAGTVYSLPVSPTEYVNQGDRLLSLADLSKLQVRGYFDEPEIGQLEIGQPVTIVWDARPNETWHGHISRLPSTIITYGTRNVGAVVITIDDADDSLLPDTNVRVTVTVSNVSNVLKVPRDALHVEQGAKYVYRKEGDTLHRVKVTIGVLNLTDVQITSGLQAGDVVALGTTNAQPLSEGIPVKVVQ
ncbi:MAG: efflux RND transporter periplasmic adaptor subunit [Acidobacteriota bacterium]